MNTLLKANTTPQACKHCSKPLPANLEAFCCPGCEVAYEIISNSGWSHYYDVRDLETAAPVEVDGEDLSFDYLNTSDYRDRYTLADGNGLTTDWFMEGLRCGACSWLVEKACRSFDGVLDANLNFSEARLHLRFRKETNLSELARVLARLGYVAGLTPTEGLSRNRELLKLGLTGAIAGNMMLMNIPFYLGLQDGRMMQIFAVIGALLAVPLLAYSARDFYVRAFQAIRAGFPSLDIPIALGLSGAFGLSLYHMLTGSVEGIYFDSMGMLVFFLLLGQFVRNNALGKALSESRRLLARMPRLVETLRDGDWLALPAGELVMGDTIRLRTGDVLPLDAALLSEHATLNLHVVTGESHPVQLSEGDGLLAGSVNLGGELLACATSTYNDSRLARLEDTARRLSRRDDSVLGSRWSGYFLLFAFAAALTAAALWWPVSVEQAFMVALTIFIVVCPCALALAEPTAEAFALRYAAGLGAWIKQTDVFRLLPQVRRVVFDKTGILTEGKPTVAFREILHAKPHWLEAAVITLEEQVRHPVADALRDGLRLRLTVGPASDVRVIPGAGVAGIVDDHHLVIASPQRLGAFGVAEPVVASALAHCQKLEAGHTVVAVVMDGVLAAIYGLRDQPRPEASGLVAGLAQRGIKQTLLSGDEQRTTLAVARQLGIESAKGGVLPEDKLAYVEAHQPEQLLMAGDGFNDMGALGRAGVSVTHAQASEAALRYATVIFRDRDMSRLDRLFALAQTCRFAVRAGVVLSLAYNVLAVALAFHGAIGPLGAALLMPASSASLIVVIALCFKFRRHSWGS